MNPLVVVAIIVVCLLVVVEMVVRTIKRGDKPTITDRLWLHIEAVHECEMRARAWHENRGAEFNTDEKLREHHYINAELDRLYAERKELLCLTH